MLPTPTPVQFGAAARRILLVAWQSTLVLPAALRIGADAVGERRCTDRVPTDGTVR